MGPHGGSGGCGSIHLPASGKAAPASLISWVTSVFTRPSPAATRLVGMRRTPRPARWPPKLTGKSAKGNARDLPTRRHPNISRRPAHLVSGVCSGMILSVLKHVRRHPRALPLLQARVCVPLPLHAGLVCGVWRSGGLSLCCCCWLWSLSLSSGICCWPPSLEPVPAPGPTRRSYSAVKSSCLPSTRLTTNAPSKELVPYDQHQHQHQRNSKGCQTGDGARAAAGVRRKHGARLTACRSRRAAGT